ncbi:AMP-binding protein [Novosphingobium sp. Gsoil 351]|uniref:AMP-binding protein n=1 Tax=Novosphingobium sp. Gsoil 351 TaxID=2675225 RepID=UPI0012B45C3A|nr:AMP-binding protein [Novosphingobium sp. Gsoil 351]QGN55032.1 AMP-binding protein [Novosphingobium sp. Gsoil 351]
MEREGPTGDKHRPYALLGTKTPDKAAVVLGSGARTSHGELEHLVNKREHALRQCGLVGSDRFAFQLENSVEFLATALAGLRIGLVVVPLSTLLTATEVAFIVADSGSRLLIVSTSVRQRFEELLALPGLPRTFVVGGEIEGLESWESLCANQPDTPPDNEAPGREMLYSSGTTGKPKGIVYHATDVGRVGGVSEAVMSVASRFGLSDETVYLCPAPLYHSAPYAWAIAVIRLGGTLVLMERFEPVQALQLIERHQINVAQFVPTHFVRMLKLPDEQRHAFDLSSLDLVIHAAAPCPVEVKRNIIEWLGPIVSEYFGSSEQSVLTMIDTPQWLERPGSVGRCVTGALRICDDFGDEVPAGTIGTVYADGGMRFSYHNDPERTATAHHAKGWSTVGDVGYLDSEDFLYLTDRSSFLIITGGVNVYPQEIENLLVTHPTVADAAVVGVPDDEMGEIVTAFVQLVNSGQATPEFAAELRTWLRGQLSGAKVPKRIVFADDLPRLPTGKMKKHLLLERIGA